MPADAYRLKMGQFPQRKVPRANGGAAAYQFPKMKR